MSSWDRNRSPVGWYVASYLMRLIEINADGKKNPKRRFLSWENTFLIKAKNLDQAYAKASKIGRLGTEDFLGGPRRVPMR